MRLYRGTLWAKVSTDPPLGQGMMRALRHRRPAGARMLPRCTLSPCAGAVAEWRLVHSVGVCPREAMACLPLPLDVSSAAVMAAAACTALLLNLWTAGRLRRTALSVPSAVSCVLEAVAAGLLLAAAAGAGPRPAALLVAGAALISVPAAAVSLLGAVLLSRRWPETARPTTAAAGAGAARWVAAAAVATAVVLAAGLSFSVVFVYQDWGQAPAMGMEMMSVPPTADRPSPLPPTVGLEETQETQETYQPPGTTDETPEVPSTAGTPQVSDITGIAEETPGASGSVEVPPKNPQVPGTTPLSEETSVSDATAVPQQTPPAPETTGAPQETPQEPGAADVPQPPLSPAPAGTDGQGGDPEVPAETVLSSQPAPQSAALIRQKRPRRRINDRRSRWPVESEPRALHGTSNTTLARVLLHAVVQDPSIQLNVSLPSSQFPLPGAADLARLKQYLPRAGVPPPSGEARQLRVSPPLPRTPSRTPLDPAEILKDVYFVHLLYKYGPNISELHGETGPGPSQAVVRQSLRLVLDAVRRFRAQPPPPPPPPTLQQPVFRPVATGGAGFVHFPDNVWRPSRPLQPARPGGQSGISLQPGGQTFLQPGGPGGSQGTDSERPQQQQQTGGPQQPQSETVGPQQSETVGPQQPPVRADGQAEVNSTAIRPHPGADGENVQPQRPEHEATGPGFRPGEHTAMALLIALLITDIYDRKCFYIFFVRNVILMNA